MITSALNQESLYTNPGNTAILPFIGEDDRLILDIGCGAGDNGRLIKSRFPATKIAGVTCSKLEYEKAIKILDQCFCTDLEKDQLPDTLNQDEFDVFLFCHVLEHLVDPIAVIRKLLPRLRDNGKVIIAVPNIAHWKQRWKLALGKFEYTDTGVMDRTHLHFYTYFTAVSYLTKPLCELSLSVHVATPDIPATALRSRLLNAKYRKDLDSWLCSLSPNLIGAEVIMVLYKK